MWDLGVFQGWTWTAPLGLGVGAHHPPRGRTEPTKWLLYPPRRRRRRRKVDSEEEG